MVFRCDGKSKCLAESSSNLEIRHHHASWPKGACPVAPTLIARAPASIYWDDGTAPIAFAVERYSDIDAYHHDNRDAAVVRLAVVFHPMMQLFLEYYLAHRADNNEAMPEWMILFGVVFDDQFGYEAVGLHPTWHPTRDPPTGQPVGWGATARIGNIRDSDMMVKSPWRHMRLMETIGMLQAHNMVTLGHLQSWPGYCDAAQKCAMTPFSHVVD